MAVMKEMQSEINTFDMSNEWIPGFRCAVSWL